MKSIILLTRRLLYNKGGGVNSSIINRANDLTSKGYKVSVATVKEYSFKKDIKKLKKVNKLKQEVTALNMYEHYRDQNTYGDVTIDQIEHYNNETRADESSPSQPLHLSLQKGNKKLEKKKTWTKDGWLKKIKYYDAEGKKKFEEEFSENKAVRKLTLFKQVENGYRMVKYFTYDGFCFLEKHIDEEQVICCKLYERNTGQIYQFNSTSDLSAHWLNELCANYRQKPILMCDKKELLPVFLKTNRDMAIRVGVIHNNHMVYSKHTNPSIHPLYKLLLDNIKQVDGVVVLTEKQKRDICESFQCQNKLWVIPHNVQTSAQKEQKRFNNQISVVARLHPVKRIDHVIKAFQTVVTKCPEAMLNIYGHGKEEQTLKQTISALHLNNNVALKGVTKDPGQVYQSSLATLLTSKSEGFSMVVLESMTEGTPVISYDIKYGPSDMITNMKDGILIEEDINILAKKIIYLLKHPKKAYKMGEKAKKSVAAQFGKEHILGKWMQLLNDLEHNTEEKY